MLPCRVCLQSWLDFWRAIPALCANRWTEVVTLCMCDSHLQELEIVLLLFLMDNVCNSFLRLGLSAIIDARVWRDLDTQATLFRALLIILIALYETFALAIPVGCQHWVHFVIGGVVLANDFTIFLGCSFVFGLPSASSFGRLHYLYLDPHFQSLLTHRRTCWGC